jgi:hypothetical protein
VSSDHGPHFHSLLTLLNLCQVFMIKSVSLLPYNLGSPHLVHTLIMESTCQPDICHLTICITLYFHLPHKYMFIEV